VTNGWARVPRLALIDFLDAWEHGRQDADAARAIHDVFGASAVPVSVGIGLFCGAVTATLSPVEHGTWFTWGQTLFALLVGSRGWRALQRAPAPEEVVAPLLASAIPGIVAMVGLQLVAAVVADPTTWLSLGQVPELGLHALGQGTWSMVLLGALMASKRWLQTLVDLFVAWFVLYVSIGVGFWIVDMVGDLFLGALAYVLGWLGLGALGSLFQLLDELADLAFVASALAWVAGAAWITASEVLPQRVQGARHSYVRALQDFLNSTRR